MHIEVSTSRNVEGNSELQQQVSEEVGATLSRFSNQLTRVEVYLADENADKDGTDDMRCTIEARPAGQTPLAVAHQAGTMTEAYRGAAAKLQRLLETRFGKVESRRGRESIRYPDST